MHRSGTTFTGRILSAEPSVSYLHEPFNPGYGLRGVETMYPLPQGAPPDFVESFSGLFDSVVTLRARHRRRRRGDSPPRLLGRPLAGGEAGLTRQRARLERLFRRPGALAIKDPSLSMALPWLVERKAVRGVMMLRHPMTVFRSAQRMSWSLDFSRVGGPGLAQRLSAPGLPSAERIERMTAAEKHGYLWPAIYQESLDCEEIIRVKHEDLCVTPHPCFDRIAGHIGVELSSRVHDLLAKQTEGTTVMPTGGGLHDFVRDSRAVAWSWTDRSEDDDERALRHITAPTVEDLYGGRRPHSV